MKKVDIYTDGSALGNPGPGGYGVLLRCSGNERELAGGFKFTTNNRMEITAAIKGLEALSEPCKVDLHTDSRYLVDAIEKGWAKRWQAKNWYRTRTEKARNPDLWEILLKLCDHHQVTFHWVKGHAGHRENERCDTLCRQAAEGKNLPPDKGYQAPAKKPKTLFD